MFLLHNENQEKWILAIFIYLLIILTSGDWNPPKSLEIKYQSLIVVLYVLLHNENQEQWIWQFFIFLFFYSHFWWLKPSKIKPFFFFQKFSFDFTFWWILNNTKIHCWKSYWKALGEISWCIFEGHLRSINIPMLLLCWLFDFLKKSLVLAFWKFWNQRTCLVFHNHQHSNITSNKKKKLLNNLVVFCHTILWFKSVLEHPSFI
jgi:hypothetical protein